MKRTLLMLIFAFFVAFLATNAQTDASKRKPKQAAPKTSNVVGKKIEPQKSKTLSTKSATQKENGRQSSSSQHHGPYEENLYLLPSFQKTSDSQLQIDRVVLKEECTLLQMTSYNSGRYAWCNIDSNSYIEVNGIHYKLLHTEGIDIAPNQTNFPNASSGKNVSLSFWLFFEPIPSQTKSFNFIENSTSGWNIRNVILESGDVVNVNGEKIRTNDHIWDCLAIECTSTQTIVLKKVTPTTESTVIYNNFSEFIEDADTGKKYYLKRSTIGTKDAPTYLAGYDDFYFAEAYPALPYSVKRINISSGTKYYVKNLKIR